MQNALGYKQVSVLTLKLYIAELICSRHCTGNGSSLRALLPVSVIADTWSSSLSFGYGLTWATAALYFVGGIRVTFSIGIGAGGPAAYW